MQTCQKGKDISKPPTTLVKIVGQVEEVEGSCPSRGEAGVKCLCQTSQNPEENTDWRYGAVGNQLASPQLLMELGN